MLETVVEIGIEPEVITLVAGVLDESGSMSNVKVETINGYNSFNDSIAAEQAGKKAYVSTFLFDSDGFNPILRVIQDAVPIESRVKLTEQTYNPRGMTPLYDAIGQVISHIEASVVRLGVNKVTLLIQTDGLENTSKEFSHAAIKAKIKECNSRGWQIVFLGADLSNAHDIGVGLGVMGQNSMSYSKGQTSAMFAASAESTRSYRTGGIAASAAMDLTDEQKKKLADKN